MTEPTTSHERRDDVLHSTTLITVTYSDGSEEGYDPSQLGCPYPISVRVEQTTSVIAPGLSKRVG